jgi:DNA-binding beta-propeller fold protein YncE
MSDQPEQNGAESSPPVVVPSIIEEVAADPVPVRRAVSEDAFWGDDGERAGDPFDLEEAAARRTAGDGASSPVVARSVGDQITLPRTVALAAAGAAAAVIVALFVLWQSAGGDDSTVVVGTTVDADAEEAPGANGQSPPADGEMGDSAPSVEVAALEAEIASQAAAIASLENELADIPPPAIDGADMRRIVVAADASFVSVGNEGVAVIGPFGGYAAIDPATNAVTATSQVASGATRVMRTKAAVWITNYADNQIVRIDPIASSVMSTFEFAGPDGLAKLGPSLAVASFDGQFVAQVEPATGEILNQVDVGGTPADVLVMPDEAALWVALFDTGEVVRIDTASFSVTDRVRVGDGPFGLSLDEETLWVVNRLEGTVAAVDTASASVALTFPVGAGPTAAVVYEDDLWVTVTESGDLLQLQPETGQIITRTPLGTSRGGGPAGVAVGNGSLWVAMQGERSVVRVTPSAG